MTEVNATEPMAAIRHYINAFNQGDADGMAAMFTVPGFILDGMAPHVWHGPTTARDWYRDVLIEGEQHALPAMRSPWVNHCTTTSPATAPMWSCPGP
jgi:hypothetical protein